MTLTLWGRPNSSNVKKVLWTLGELGLPFDHILAGGSYGGVDTPEYRAMNPNALVPCLRDGDFVLWESNAIVRYLVRAYGAAPLCPDSPRSWADADRWMDWSSLALSAPLRDLVMNLIRRPPEARERDRVARAAEAFAAALAVPEAALARRPWLAGADFGPADIPFGVMAATWAALPMVRPDLPHLSRWLDALAERPAFRAAVMVPLS